MHRRALTASLALLLTVAAAAAAPAEPTTESGPAATAPAEPGGSAEPAEPADEVVEIQLEPEPAEPRGLDRGAAGRPRRPAGGGGERAGGEGQAAPGERSGPRPATRERHRDRARSAAARRRARARRARAKRRARRRRAIASVRRGDYVLPIAGRVIFGDDYGAPRASTGRHQGNDLFAPYGAPVVAVAGGTISKVGTLPISGNRLWLRDRRGNTFFYAHLAVFSHRAVNGARVGQGEVLGFTGSTGDAKPTPPHLHFEIHPADGRPIDPYRFLRRWRRAPAPTGYRLAPAVPEGVLVELRDFLAEG